MTGKGQQPRSTEEYKGLKSLFELLEKLGVETILDNNGTILEMRDTKKQPPCKKRKENT